MEHFHSIGAFSRIVQISIKALRFYETCGLLAPAKVDEQTGYRYFSDRQIPVANAIVTLRSTGMSVAEVAATVGADPSRGYTEALRQRHRTLLEERRHLDRQIALVETLLRSGATLGSYRLVPVDPVLALHRIVRPGDADSIAQTFEALERQAASSNARAPTAPFCELHGDDDWRVCVPITDVAGDEREADFLGRVGVACSITYVGAYEQTRSTLESMRAWLAERDIPSAGPAREIYHRFGADQEGYKLPSHVLAAQHTHYVTELQIPIELPGVRE